MKYLQKKGILCKEVHEIQCNSEEAGYEIQAEHNTEIHSVKSSKNLNHWWTNRSHSS